MCAPFCFLRVLVRPGLLPCVYIREDLGRVHTKQRSCAPSPRSPPRLCWSEVVGQQARPAAMAFRGGVDDGFDPYVVPDIVKQFVHYFYRHIRSGTHSGTERERTLPAQTRRCCSNVFCGSEVVAADPGRAAARGGAAAAAIPWMPVAEQPPRALRSPIQPRC